MNTKRIRGLGPLLVSVALMMPVATQAQGVPTIDLTSIARIGQVLTEA
jgi:type IV secretion system protein VirB5